MLSENFLGPKAYRGSNQQKPAANWALTLDGLRFSHTPDHGTTHQSVDAPTGSTSFALGAMGSPPHLTMKQPNNYGAIWRQLTLCGCSDDAAHAIASALLRSGQEVTA